MNFSEARALAECWVSLTSNGEGVIDSKSTVTLPYGWVFFWNSRAFLADPTNYRKFILGNVPILIDSINGELRLLGGIDWKERLKILESSFPRSWFAMTPEPPQR